MFIVLYGINNLGKSTQAKLLTERMNTAGYTTEYIKYPIYDLAPSGPLINAYLREGNPHELTPREIQILQVLNRTQYEHILKQKLDQGIHIVAEDYVGTGICWGMGAGVSEELLKHLNQHLVQEDISFLFQGTRFTEATEQGHKHETDDTLMEAVRLAHEKLGDEYGWIRINANDSIEHINNILWDTIHARLTTTTNT